MAFRKSGFSVILQPFAVVYHQEGSSVFGADSDLKKELMTRNKQLFYSKWEEELKVRFGSVFIKSIC
jgi:GT2 family glycosyltransferase